MKINQVIIACCWMLPAFVQTAVAQEVLLDEHGRRIVMNQDGSWRLFFENDPMMGAFEKSKLDTPANHAADANRRKYESAELATKKLLLDLIQARVEKVQAEQGLSEIRLKSDIPIELNISAENRYNSACQKLEKLTKEYELAKKRAEFMGSIVYYPADAFIRKLEKWELENAKGKPLSEDVKDRPYPPKRKEYKQYDPIDDVILTPPPISCKMGFEGKDANGKMMRVVEPAVIFSKTDPALAKKFPQSDFIVGRGYLTRISGGVLLFKLEVTVATQRASEILGVIKLNELLEIQLLNGNVLRLFNQLKDAGYWEPAAGVFVYQAQYALGLKDEKLLRSSELDLVRIRWSKVQEEFPVYELDFFKNQFACLDFK